MVQIMTNDLVDCPRADGMWTVAETWYLTCTTPFGGVVAISSTIGVVTSGESLLNNQQRKKARRKARKQSERQAHRNLDDVTSSAVAASLVLARTVADTHKAMVIDVELASVSEAKFVRKRVNDALQIGEWLDDVQVVLWQVDEHWSAPLSEQGERKGFELRIDRARRDPAH